MKFLRSIVVPWPTPAACERLPRWKVLAWPLMAALVPGSSTGLSATVTRAAATDRQRSAPPVFAPALVTLPAAAWPLPAGWMPARGPASPAPAVPANGPVAVSTAPGLTTPVSVTPASVTPVLATPGLAAPVQRSALAAPTAPYPAAPYPAAPYKEPFYPAAEATAGNGRGLVMVDASTASDVLHLVVGRSLVLSAGVPLRRIYVGDPKVLQSFSPGPQEDVITARASGVSTLILWDTSGRRRVYTVFADVDTEGLARAIGDALPDAQVAVSAKTGRVYLAGTVSSTAEAEQLGKMASAYSREVVDGVRVVEAHGKQIELKLRIVEVDRSRLQQFGVNFFALGGSTLAGTSTQQFSTTVTPATSTSPLTVSDPLNLLLYSAKLNAGVTVKDLEQKQVLQVLAEPTLTTLSGIAARFLSGGEFPLPVVQGGTGNSTAITIVWKPYGVKVEFTPTANADGTIRLKVAPEVSTLDYTNAVTISGFTVPALSTRKAETEVELQDGQSFIISGLLDHRTADNLSRMPGIANLPILGQLFRSKGLTLSTVDLVVLVTATVVDPLAPAAPASGPGAEPKMVLPNLDKERFDEELGRGGRKKPAPSSGQSQPSQPGSQPNSQPGTVTP